MDKVRGIEVIDKLKSGFLWWKIISVQPCKNIDNEIVWRAMSRMLDLINVLELVKDGFNQSSFAEEELIRHGSSSGSSYSYATW